MSEKEKLTPRYTRIAEGELTLTPHGAQIARQIGAQHELREMIREEVEAALHPGAIDPRAYRHVDITDSDGQRWRGMVYLVEPMSASPLAGGEK